jgi:hypothetical protein
MLRRLTRVEILMALGLLLVTGRPGHAGEILPANGPAALAVDDLHLALPVSFPDAGTGQVVVDVDSSLQCPANVTPQQLVASLDEAMPAGTVLEIAVDTGRGAGSFQPMSARGRTLTLLLPKDTSTRVAFRYRFRHHLTAPIGAFSRNLVFTLVEL